jgi:hypothetical protein
MDQHKDGACKRRKKAYSKPRINNSVWVLDTGFSPRTTRRRDPRLAALKALTPDRPLSGRASHRRGEGGIKSNLVPGGSVAAQRKNKKVKKSQKLPCRKMRRARVSRKAGDAVGSWT